jgi:hypothetical protein
VQHSTVETWFISGIYLQIPCVKVIDDDDDDDDDDNNNNNNSESTNVKLQTLNMENNSTHSINCNFRISATLYSIETRFASGI